MARVRERLRNHERNTVPARAKVSGEERADLFEKMLTAVQGSVARVTSADQVPGAIREYLGMDEADICINGEVEEMDLPWGDAPGIRPVPWVARSSLGVSVTGCFAAAAETGTVAIMSSNLNPLTLNFLAERHIVILFADQLVGSYEEIWDRVRARGALPRDVTFVSGPSCTGDIEMMLEYGAHGPRSLHVIIVSGRG
ncbi:MAG: lactate utilization protein [Pseudomonadales bacterium]|nr:lactate utilization protein [Pseudomonadales bacterium]